MYIKEKGVRAGASDKLYRTRQGLVAIRAAGAEVTALCDGEKRYITCVWTSVFLPGVPYLFVVTKETVLDAVLANDHAMHEILDAAKDEADIDTYTGSVYAAQYARALDAVHEKLDEMGWIWPENEEDPYDDPDDEDYEDE